MEKLFKLFLGLLVGSLFLFLPKGLTIVLWGVIPAVLWQVLTTFGFVLVVIFGFYALVEALKTLKKV